MTVRDIADVLIADKRWDRHGPTRRYRDVHPRLREAELSRLVTGPRDRHTTPTTAATEALVNLLPLPPSSGVPLADNAQSATCTI